MPRYEFSTFVVVKAVDEQDARDQVARATALLEENAVILGVEDGEPVVDDTDEREQMLYRQDARP